MQKTFMNVWWYAILLMHQEYYMVKTMGLAKRSNENETKII